MAYILPLVLLAILGLLLYWHLLQQRELVRLRSERESIVGEERRMFDFLHGLGEALSHDDPEEKMYRLIVEGAAVVADAVGGAIYIHNPEKGELEPAFCSAGAPPIIDLPERIITRSRADSKTLGSYLKLHGVPEGEGILGEVFQSQQGVNLKNLRDSESFRTTANPYQQNVAAMVAPLSAGESLYGVLVIADDRIGRSFSDNDYEVFLSVTEQSSYAISSARIHQEAIEKRRIEGDLKNASEIQRVLLPKTDPQLEDYRFSAINLPAKVVSGDYYDYVRIDGDRYGVTLGDVSGKGLPAALVAAMSRSILRASAVGHTSPSEVLSELNRTIFPDIREDMFITKAYLVLDRNSDEITLARAGHNPPLHYEKASGEVTEIEPRGMAIGVDAGPVFDRIITDHTVRMAPGDCLLLYTDGATEAIDRKGLEFDVPRLIKEFARSAPDGPQVIIKHLQQNLEAFMAGVPQTDDITLIAIEKR